MDALLQNFFNLAVWREVGPYLLQGLWMTLGLSALVLPIGLASGLLLAIALHHNPPVGLRRAIRVWIELFRAFPPLVLLIFVAYGLPFVGLDLPKLGAVLLAFGLNNSAYFAEVWRGGFEALPTGQEEAALASGMTRLQALRHVLLPQVWRITVGDHASNAIEVVKLTTIASAVALPELLRHARDAQALVYNPSPVVLAALLYLALLWPAVHLLSRRDRRVLVV